MMIVHPSSSASAAPSTKGTSGRMVCQYINKTKILQVVRISNIPGYFFDRVVFAGQQLLIDVDSEAVLEIHSHQLASAILCDRIPCRQLRYAEPLSVSPSTHPSSDYSPAQTTPRKPIVA